VNKLSESDIDRIVRHDWEVHGQHGYHNRNRFYIYLIAPLFSPDLEVHTVAVKSARRAGQCGNRPTYVKEVMRASVDHKLMHIRDVAFGMMSGYTVDWSKEGLNKVSWDYKGNWQAEPYSATRGLWKIHGEVINPSVLQYHERFKYCSWTLECGHILDYLKVYVNHPRVEMLSKVGAGRFATKAGFVSQLEKDKGLMRWFSQHLEEIKSENAGCDVIRMAHRRGLTLNQAKCRIQLRRMYSKMGLPKAVDATRAHEFVSKTKGIHDYAYCDYLRQCKEIGLDLADTKTAFPRQWKKRMTIVGDQYNAVMMRRKAERDAIARREREALRKRQDADIAATVKKFARFEKARGMFSLMLPRKADDLVREGKRLHNCLGDGHYAAKMARGETLIAFVRHARRPGAAFVAVEYSPDQKKVLQCYGDNNSKPPKPAVDFVNRIFLRRKVAA
jgi:hypothetical protein